MTRHVTGLVLGVLVSLPGVALARDFYVDPMTGSSSGDGSADRPWHTLEEVVNDGLIETQHWSMLPYMEGATLMTVNPGAPVKAGDTIWLRSGYHGELVIQGGYNEMPITIAAEDGERPDLRRVLLRAAGNWVLRGLTISPSFGDPFERVTMVDIDTHDWQGPSWDIVVEDCEMFSVDDASSWTDTDWDTLSCNGVSVDGDRVTIRNNTLRNVNFGISVGGEDALIDHNTIDGFAGDGLRGLGDRGVFQYNTVKNCYDVNDNHDDGFQSWSVGPDGVGTGEVHDVVLRGNLIINYEDPDQPYRGTLQGIGCFDGFFVGWVVENNVVITDHWHGITLDGARDSRIVNNTVIDLNTDDPGPPWIMIGPHKDDTPSTGCLVRNNLTTNIVIPDGQDVTEDHNLEISMDELSAFFVDPAAHDLHLLPTAAAIDMGIADMAPGIDRDGIPRPQGAGFDLGAYEWHEPDVMPVDAGVPDAGGGGSDAGPGADSGTPGRDGGGAGTDAGDGGGGGGDGGCGCSAPGRATGSGAVVLLALAWLWRRRPG